MQYFGVPKCPYCNKRVNIIRTWSLKKQGEYKCPRCGGISNIFLSPLIWIFAVLAIFSSVALFFFHKFVLDDIELKTAIQVLIPFAIFFLISLFMVYLKKPVIKRVSRADMEKKKRGNIPSQQVQRSFSPDGARMGETGNIYRDDDFVPGPREEQMQAQARPNPQPAPQQARPVQKPTSVPPQAQPPVRPRPPQQAAPSQIQRQRPPQPETVPDDMAKTAVVNSEQIYPAKQRLQEPVNTTKPAAPQTRSSAPAQQPRRARVENAGDVAATRPQSNDVRQRPPETTAPAPKQPIKEEPVEEKAVKSIDIGDDFFAKYNDPEYVNKRIEEKKNESENKQ